MYVEQLLTSIDQVLTMYSITDVSVV